MGNKITTYQAAAILGVNRALFASYRAKLPGLPKPCMQQGNRLFFDDDEIIEFGKSNDTTEILRAFFRQRYAEKTPNYKPRVRPKESNVIEDRPKSLSNVNVARLF